MPAGWKLTGSHSEWKLTEPNVLEYGEKTLGSRAEFHGDAGMIENDLRRGIRGEVRFNDGDRALYATDGSNYRQVPIGVVIPRDSDDVIETLAVCRAHGAPVLARGGGTSLAGQCCNVAVIIDFSKYLNQVISIDVERRLARVMPGTILDDLRHRAEKFDLTFGPDPSTHDHCTLGGMIGNNSCGVHAQMAGRTSDNIHELDIVTYDGARMKVGATSELELERIINEGGRRGEIYRRLKRLRDKYASLIRGRYPKIPRRVSGYNLDELLPERGFHVARALVGSEGTCVTVLEATAKLVYHPPKQVLLVLGYPDVYEAADHIMEIGSYGPIGLEGMDETLLRLAHEKGIHDNARPFIPGGRGWLLVEFGGESADEARAKAQELMARLKAAPNPPTMSLIVDKTDQVTVWKLRESGLGATARYKDGTTTWPGWEDSAVPPEKVSPYLRELRALYNKYGFRGALYGHFGQGCIHVRTPFELGSAEGLGQFRSFMDEATSLCVKFGGSLSGEHGDGQSRAEFLPKMFGPELIEAFREFKSIWDPQWRMNPGKVVDPYRIDENLRLGTGYRPPEVRTHFHYTGDEGSMARATLRCVGVGKCRRLEKGTMCPSFMVTREEKHSTRGRARLLHEMLSDSRLLEEGWRSEAVKDALDLCLSCKGCKGDCPVNVDMATYKAEFLSHYYRGKARPRWAYAMGLIDFWASLASKAPELANFITQTPILRDLAKFVGGIAPQRSFPKFARTTFKDWYRRRGARNKSGPPVILWADTFNNYFHPDTAAAALEVLEDAGYRVIAPTRHLCCGRPLYDYGMLDLAKGYLGRVISELRPLIRAGIPVVGLEPSCVAVFRDELGELMPNDLDAGRLSRQTFMLSEFLEKKAKHWSPPRLERKAIIQGHCHHKAVIKLKDEESLMKKMGLDADVLDSGCCGLAGSFGFEAAPSHYDVSMKAGERVLLPAVRKAPEDTLIIADGFSCRTQIEQGTGRKALHLAQVLRMALRDRKVPEQLVSRMPPSERKPARNKALAIGIGGLVAAGWLISKASGTGLASRNQRSVAERRARRI